MSFLQGLGAFAGGVGKGMQLTEQIQDMKEKREDRKKQKDILEEIKNAGINELNKDQQSIQIADPNAAPIQQQQNEQMPYGLGSVDYTSQPQSTQVAQIEQQNYPNFQVQKFADGGMVQDQSAMVTQVNNNAGLSSMQPTQQTQQVQAKPKKNPGYALSKSFSAMRDKALELGRPDLALQYQQAGFQIRDRLFKDGLADAQRTFDMTGGIDGFVKLYNDAIDDGAGVDSYERTPNGYKLLLNMNGQKVEREFSADQIRDMVMNFNDPAARYAAERSAMEARNKKTFETNEEIRKAQATEKAKVHSVGLDSVLVGNDGNVIYDGSGNRPKFRNDQEVYAAANDPADPRNAVAKSMIKQMHTEKVAVARESRAPKEDKKPSLEERAYEDWAKKPENAGKGISDFLKDKSQWGSGVGLDTVTTSETTIDPRTGAETGKMSRTTKVPKGEELPNKNKGSFDLNKFLH